MRKTVLLTIVLLVLAAWAVAQQGTNPSAPGSNSQAPSAGSSAQDSAPQATSAETTVEGCLGGTAGNYTIADKSGAIYKLQVSDDESAAIGKHIGQQVRVKGMLADAAGDRESASAADADASKESAGKAAKSIKPTAIEKIADTCGDKPEAAPSKQ